MVLEHTLARLRSEFAGAGQARRFERLKVFLTGEAEGVSHAEVAADLKMTEDAVKVAIHRLRKRYRNLLRDEIAKTLEDASTVEDEVQALIAVLRGPGRR